MCVWSQQLILSVHFAVEFQVRWCYSLWNNEVVFPRLLTLCVRLSGRFLYSDNSEVTGKLPDLSVTQGYWMIICVCFWILCKSVRKRERGGRKVCCQCSMVSSLCSMPHKPSFQDGHTNAPTHLQTGTCTLLIREQVFFFVLYFPVTDTELLCEAPWNTHVTLSVPFIGRCIPTCEQILPW